MRFAGLDFRALRRGIEDIAAYGFGFLRCYRNAGSKAGNQDFAVVVRDKIADCFAVRIGDMERGSGNRRGRVRDEYPYHKAFFRTVPERQFMQFAVSDFNILRRSVENVSVHGLDFADF